MWCMAWRLGAPVTEPQGKRAANSSLRRRSLRLRAVMVDVICQTVGRACSSNRSGTRTLPTSATRDRSLRSRSTIIRFSARSLALVRRCSAAAASVAASGPRGAVPFMGRVVMCSPSQSKNSSGETLSTAPGTRQAARASSIRA